MAATMVPLQSITLTGSAASVTFSGIPQTYTDLVLRISERDDSTATGAGYGFTIQFNSATTNQSQTVLYGQGSTAGSYRTSDLRLIGTGNSGTANTFGSHEIYIPNYTASAAHPVSVTDAVENNTAGDNWIAGVAGLWNSATAITSITLDPYTTASFVGGSSFHLYGIKNT